MIDGTERILTIASNETGLDFLRQCAQMGVKATLLTVDKHRDAYWPRETLEELVTMPAGLNREQILNTVSWMARGRRFDRIVALDEFDQETAAAIREHMRIPGMGCTTAGCYRDKLAMRVIGRALGFPVPEFCRVLNYDELREFMERVRPPWLLKPRREASVLGVRRIEEPEQLWRRLDDLGDEQSRCLLEQFVAGEIFHVDSIVSEGEVKFATVQQYGRPPLPAMHEGWVSTLRTVDRDGRDAQELIALNRRLAPALGMLRGVTHAEYVRAQDGRFYFTEVAARVGGALTAEVVETATGVNLWREWARLEIANLRGEDYVLPDRQESYAGSVVCAGEAAELEMAGFDAAEIVARVKRHGQRGLIVRSDKAERVKTLVEELTTELAGQILSTLPPFSRT